MFKHHSAAVYLHTYFLQIVHTLGTESSHPSNAAQCIAAIAQIELPLNQWPELVLQLVHNCTAAPIPDPLKEASIEALGYIVEDIVSNSIQGGTKSDI